MDKEISEGARALGRLGAKARSEKLSPAERKQIGQRAIAARWAKAGKAKREKEASVAPRSILQGVLKIADIELPCHVLDDKRRVLTQAGMISSLGMSQGSGGASAGGGDRLTNFLTTKSVSPYVSANVYPLITGPIIFLTSSGTAAYGYEATLLPDICDAVLHARQEGKLQKQQQHIARQCEVLVRSFAKVGIIALIDEATGYQRIREKFALQLKFQAFIADELQDWALVFPQEFWFELARLEGINYSAKSRPLRWGKYIMMFVYDAIDKDIGKMLREKNPNPHFGENHHQWLKQFGKDKVHDQLQRVITIMKLCKNMDEFKANFAKVFAKSPAQLDMDFTE